MSQKLDVVLCHAFNHLLKDEELKKILWFCFHGIHEKKSNTDTSFEKHKQIYSDDEENPELIYERRKLKER